MNWMFQIKGKTLFVWRNSKVMENLGLGDFQSNKSFDRDSGQSIKIAAEKPKKSSPKIFQSKN